MTERTAWLVGFPLGFFLSEVVYRLAKVVSRALRGRAQ